MGPKLEPLVAEYVRGVEGAHDVLRDALLERGLEPLPRDGAVDDRLVAVFERLSRGDQRRIASASVGRLVTEVADTRTRGLVVAALDAVDAAPGAAAPEVVRNELFRTWQVAAPGSGKRVVWAAWMLLRELPATTLRTARVVREGELEHQIAAVAAALARELT